MTEWREVPGFPKYEVSSQGEIRNRTTLQVLKQQVHRRGYHTIHTAPDGKILLMHRALAAAFLGPVEGKVVRHLDGNPSNNTLSNLAIGTQSENMYDAVRHGTHAQTSKTSCSRGHLYSSENTRIRANGGRECKPCERENHATLVAAAQSLGMTYAQYRAKYGQSRTVANNFLNPKETP